MKKNDAENSFNQTTSRHIFRKKKLDETTSVRKEELNEIRLSDFGDFSADDVEETGFDDVEFGFTEEDIERFKQQNLQDTEDENESENEGKIRKIGPLARRRSKKVKDKLIMNENETVYDIGLKKQTNKEILRVTFMVIFVFMAMVAYLIHFNVVTAEKIINDEHNSRLEILESKIIRGSIYSADGEVLAESYVAPDGSISRLYPFGRQFAHVIGTSGINKSGVELSSEYYLVTSDIDPVQKIKNDISGEKSQGNEVITTLNSRLQTAAYQALGDRKGVVIALEPDTGKVLAMVSKPDYDPNTLKDDYESIVAEEGNKSLLNQATQGTFTPGSIFKIITTLAFIRSGMDTDAYSYYCDGAIGLRSENDTSYLKCYAGEVHGNVSLEDSFVESCNASFANIGLSIKSSELAQTASELLFNQELPTDFTTSRSYFSLPSGATEWLVGATAIGQGHTAITPMHAAMIVSAIANKGHLMEPYVIDSIETADGETIHEYKGNEYGTLLSKEESSILTDMMRETVSSGTAYRLADRSYSPVGKTGTAEVSGSGNNAWFVGFAPADDPEIVLCVLVEDAESSSSSVAVPIAGEVFDAFFY